MKNVENFFADYNPDQDLALNKFFKCEKEEIAAIYIIKFNSYNLDKSIIDKCFILNNNLDKIQELLLFKVFSYEEKVEIRFFPSENMVYSQEFLKFISSAKINKFYLNCNKINNNQSLENLKNIKKLIETIVENKNIKQLLVNNIPNSEIFKDLDLLIKKFKLERETKQCYIYLNTARNDVDLELSKKILPFEISGLLLSKDSMLGKVNFFNPSKSALKNDFNFEQNIEFQSSTIIDELNERSFKKKIKELFSVYSCVSFSMTNLKSEFMNIICNSMINSSKSFEVRFLPSAKVNYSENFLSALKNSPINKFYLNCSNFKLDFNKKCPNEDNLKLILNATLSNAKIETFQAIGVPKIPGIEHFVKQFNMKKRKSDTFHYSENSLFAVIEETTVHTLKKVNDKCVDSDTGLYKPEQSLYFNNTKHSNTKASRR